MYDPKPAYAAARTLTARLAGCTFKERVPCEHPDDYVLVFVKGEELAWPHGQLRRNRIRW